MSFRRLENLSAHTSTSQSCLDSAPQSSKVRKAVAHEMNNIIASRRAAGLPVYNMNQGLVRTNAAIESENKRLLGSVNSVELWEMGRVPGLDELREEVAAWRGEVFGQSISKENVFITVGASNAFLLSVLALTNSRDKIQFITPYFFNHANAADLLDRQKTLIPLRAEDSFSIDSNKIATEWDSTTKLMVLSNPHNPTGVHFSRREMQRLESQIALLGGHLIVDESYTGFVYNDECAEGAAFDLTTTILQGSFSKVLSLGDLRLGYSIANAELIEQFVNLQDNLVICPSVLLQRLALQVIKQRDILLPGVKEELKRRSEIFDEALTTTPHTLRFSGNSGVFKWIELSPHFDDEAFVLHLAHSTGVIGTPGAAYGAPKWIRLTYGMLDDGIHLAKACDQLRSALIEYEAEFKKTGNV